MGMLRYGAPEREFVETRVATRNTIVLSAADGIRIFLRLSEGCRWTRRIGSFSVWINLQGIERCARHIRQQIYRLLIANTAFHN